MITTSQSARNAAASPECSDWPVSVDDRETYERDGVVHLRQPFESPLIRGLAERMNRMLDDASVCASDLLVQHAPGRAEIYNAVRSEPLFRDFVFGSTVAEIAGRIAGSRRVQFYFDVTFCKVGVEGGIGDRQIGATTLHQDVASFAFKGRQMPSLWLALTDIPADAGPLLFALGSHKYRGTLFRAAGNHGLPPIDGYRDHTEVDAFILQKGFAMKSFPVVAGDVIVIHPFVLHGSVPVTDQSARRLGFCTRWLGDDVTWQPSLYTAAEVRTVRTPLEVGSRPPASNFPVVWPRA